MALDLDPSHLPTLGGPPRRSRWTTPTTTRPRATSIRSRATRRHRASAHACSSSSASLREEMLGEHDSAVLAWEAAHEADPENEDVALPLADEYIDDARPGTKAEPLFEMLIRKAGKRDRGEQHTLYNKLGMVARALGKDDKALKAYSAAHQLDLTDQATIRGLAEVSFRLKDWGARAHQLPEGAHRARRGREPRRAPRSTTSSAASSASRVRRSRRSTTSRRLSASTRRTARRSRRSSRIYTELKDWKQVVAYKRADPRQRRRRRRALQDAHRDRRHLERPGQEPAEGHRGLRRGARSPAGEPPAPPQAARALPGDAELGADDRHHPGDRRHGEGPDPQDASSSTRWRSSIATRRTTRSAPSSSSTRRSISTPTFLEAFERINKILTGQKDWKAARARVPQDAPPPLAANAEQSARTSSSTSGTTSVSSTATASHDMNSAIEAFKMATRYKPDEPVERQILAELYEQTDQIEAAIGEHAQRPPEGSAARRPVPQPLQALH